MGRKRKELIDESDLMLPFVYDLADAYAVVKDAAGVGALERVLRSATLVGIDTERKPDFGPRRAGVNNPNNHPTLLIQMAIRCEESGAGTDRSPRPPASPSAAAGGSPAHLGISEHCFIVDLQLMSRSCMQAFGSVFGALLTNPEVIKLGQGLDHDLWELSVSYPAMPCFRRAAALLDTNAMQRVLKPDTVQNVSLKNLVKWYLHCNLIKTQQLSNWSRRPLTPAQLHYAACDAVVLLRLYDAMGFHLKAIGNRSSSSAPPSPCPAAAPAAPAASAGAPFRSSVPAASGTLIAAGVHADGGASGAPGAAEVAASASELLLSFDYENCTSASRRSNSFDVMINGEEAAQGVDDAGGAGRAEGAGSSSSGLGSSGSAGSGTDVGDDEGGSSDDANTDALLAGRFHRCLSSVDFTERVRVHLAKKGDPSLGSLSAVQAAAVSKALRGAVCTDAHGNVGRLSNTMQHSLAAAANAPMAHQQQQRPPPPVPVGSKVHARFEVSDSDCDSDSGSGSDVSRGVACASGRQPASGKNQFMALAPVKRARREDARLGAASVRTERGSSQQGLGREDSASPLSLSSTSTDATGVASGADPVVSQRQLLRREKRRRLRREKAIRKKTFGIAAPVKSPVRS